ncbi:hypothetical protein B0H16DRAFT_715359 [Mycena metata]|uniref:Actin-like ATPase domain-containing protein n=1 Tax=Mycena metata TaxID=1033252 RepID=A0AAD7J3B1_9AGAR|nr:hypothetical protein B0H16DRAFT_715359 [Mycena metata]
MAPKIAFTGPAPKLILGIDIGTTFSGMSFCLLEPGKLPEILPVTRFPAQDHIGGDSKVPSIIYYDASGRARAFGAEALQESVVEQAEEEGWQKAEWFKLHLRPTGAAIREDSVPPLPANKNALDVFTDFLRYLFGCAKAYIVDRYPNGNARWIGLESTIEYVLTHPNGWSGEQQSKMRSAAIIAGLIPNTLADSERIHFVTEGEASLNFCITNGLATDPLRLGKGIIIVDAGGGTVDITAYRQVTTPKGDSFEEIARPQCLFEGAIFVSERAHDYLKCKLQGSKYQEDATHITKCFDKNTKLRFRSTDAWSYIQFGRPSDKSEEFNITSGRMKLASDIVAGFFKPSLDAILRSVTTQCETSEVPISSVLLVGGFAASEWLHSELKKHLNSQNLEVFRPDSHVNKAVADGAISFYLEARVSARISKHTYGIEIITPYTSTNAEHVTRAGTAFTDVSGVLMVPKKFSAILDKDTRVSATKEFCQSYHQRAHDAASLRAVSLGVLHYQGEDKNPRWTDIESENFPVLCTINADTSEMAKTLEPQQGQSGTYYRIDFDVVLSFGLTELKAQIAWIENGVEKRGPAQLAY